MNQHNQEEQKTSAAGQQFKKPMLQQPHKDEKNKKEIDLGSEKSGKPVDPSAREEVKNNGKQPTK